jgi:O-antigen/teichoic acid export membrane protein
MSNPTIALNHLAILLKNISYGALIRITALAISFLNIAICLRISENSEYGLWITIYSVIMWITYFDLGLGASLRNQFADLKSKSDHSKLKKIVSNGMLFLFSMGLIILFLSITTYFLISQIDFLIKFIEYKWIFALPVPLFSVFIMFSGIKWILIGDEKNYISEFIQLTINILITIILCIFFILEIKATAINFSQIYLIPSLIIIVFFTLYLFSTEYKDYKPNWASINFSILKGLSNLGFGFFIIQMCSLVTLQASNLIIFNLYSAETVVQYNLHYQIFNSVIILAGFLSNPLYGSLAKAYGRNDLIFIKTTIKQFFLVHIAIAIFILSLIYFASEYLIVILSGQQNLFDNSLAIYFYFNFFLVLFISVFSIFLSAIGELRWIIRIALFNTIAYIPLVLFLNNYFGIYSVILSNIILSTMGSIFILKQAHTVIQDHA